MSQVIIRSTLMTALAAFAADYNPPLEIAREGIGFEKPTDGSSFLEAILVPAETHNPTTDGERKRYRGIFQINVWTPDNVGAGPGEAIAEEIALLFPLVPKSYLPVSIESTPSIKRAITDVGGWRVTPVCVDYRMEA